MDIRTHRLCYALYLHPACPAEEPAVWIAGNLDGVEPGEVAKIIIAEQWAHTRKTYFRENALSDVVYAIGDRNLQRLDLQRASLESARKIFHNAQRLLDSIDHADPDGAALIVGRAAVALRTGQTIARTALGYDDPGEASDADARDNVFEVVVKALPERVDAKD